MLGGCCSGGMPGLGPCIAPEPGRAITGAPGEPSWLSVLAGCEGMHWSGIESSLELSGGFSLPVAKEGKIISDFDYL